jgi:hypothetical protein
MIKSWKAPAFGVFAAVSVTPALAQGAWAASDSYGYSRGFGAFAMVPRGVGGRYSAMANGGGNPGYNWRVEHDY